MLVKNNITLTYPAVIHAPDEGPLWHEIRRRFRPLRTKVPSELLIILWNNMPTSPLEECLRARQIPFLAVGKQVAVWNNLQKFLLIVEALGKTTAKYVMGLDAHDVLVLGDLSEALSQFQATSCDLMFNAESRFYPNLDIPYYQHAKSFQEGLSSSMYRYLNSGAWIGRVEFCQSFFAECSQVRLWEEFDCSDFLKVYNCDQSVVHGQFEKWQPRVKLDYGCRIFNNIAFAAPGDITILDRCF